MIRRYGVESAAGQFRRGFERPCLVRETRRRLGMY